MDLLSAKSAVSRRSESLLGVMRLGSRASQSRTSDAKGNNGVALPVLRMHSVGSLRSSNRTNSKGASGVLPSPSPPASPQPRSSREPSAGGLRRSVSKTSSVPAAVPSLGGSDGFATPALSNRSQASAFATPISSSRASSKCNRSPLPSLSVGSTRRPSKTRNSKVTRSSTCSCSGSDADLAGMDVVRWSGMRKESEQFSPEILRLALTRNLSRKYGVSAPQVSVILGHFDDASGGRNGGLLDLNGFRNALSAIYERRDLNENGVLAAWDMVTSSDVVLGEDVAQLDIDAFLQWYVAEERWATLFASTAWKGTAEAMESLARQHGIPTNVVESVKQAFDECDRNGSGILDYVEFRTMLLRMRVDGDAGPSNDAVARMWKDIDADSSGEVDFPEFVKWYLENFDPATGESKCLN